MLLKCCAGSLEEDYDDGMKPVKEDLSEKQQHQLKHRELFLSRQVETLPATHIRGKCTVTLLNETESLLSYLNRDVSSSSTAATANNIIIVNTTRTIFIVRQGHMREFTLGHWSEIWSAPGCCHLIGQAANFTFEFACRLL